MVNGSTMAEQVRQLDWSATTLGAMADWPQSLRTAVDMMLASGVPMCIYWGPECIHFYNDAFAPLLGPRHPGTLGVTAAKAWPELWDQLQPLIHRTFAGESTVIYDQPLTMTRYGYEEETWWSYAYSPIHGENGEVAGLLNVVFETTDRFRAIRDRDVALKTLSEREAFTSSILASSTDCIKVLDLDGKLTCMSDGGQRIMEVSDVNDIVGCPWPDFWQGQGNVEAVAAIEAARQGKARSFVGRANTMAGNPRWWHVAVSAILGTDGHPKRILSVSRDITALRASEAERDRFRRMAENSTEFIAMADRDGTLSYLNDAARRMVGLENTEGPYSLPDFFPPDEAERNRNEVLPIVERDGHWLGEMNFRHFRTGELIPVLHSVFAVPGAEGEPDGYGTVTVDFRDRKRAEDDMRLMNGELAHRLKNVLSVIQSVANQTIRNAPDTETASNDLSARLAALGAATDVLTHKSWRSADLRQLAEGALAPHGLIGKRILIDGPEVTLKAEVSVAFALALHELATNAAKYGALSTQTGWVTLTWTVEGEGEDASFSLCWQEQGGPEVSLPMRKGFGSTLIERSLRSYFRARVATDYRRDGLVFQLDARLGDAALVTGK